MIFLLASLLSASRQELHDHSKEECKKVLDEFHAACRNSSEATRIAALNALSKHLCSVSISAIGNLLGSDADAVRLAAAKALGTMDHPKSLEVLSAAVSTSEANYPVLDAVVKALQVLDWEAGAEALNGLLSRFHEKGFLDPLHVIIPALGKLGSGGSVDPLITLLEHAENEGKASRTGKVRTGGNPKLAALEAPIKSALQQITGGSEPNYQKWKEWWRANRGDLQDKATLVYRCKSTGKRYTRKAGESDTCPNHEKPEKDGQLVKTLLHSSNTKP
jgi:hypothetical protein